MLMRYELIIYVHIYNVTAGSDGVYYPLSVSAYITLGPYAAGRAHHFLMNLLNFHFTSFRGYERPRHSIIKQ